jgi:hypothetical protein
LISLTLGKIARFPYENGAAPIHSFRMGTTYDAFARKQKEGMAKQKAPNARRAIVEK